MSTQPEIQLTDEQWRERLDPDQYQVLRHQATERPFSGKYFDLWADGMYHCAACEAALFASDTKFDAGCGWPSFSEPVNSEAVEERVDRTHGMMRTEVLCRRCGSHLGHVFDDGPGPNGLRYCINSLSLDFDTATAGA